MNVRWIQLKRVATPVGLNLLLVAGFLAIGSLLPLQEGAAQGVTARVVDEQSRTAVVGATATLLTADSTAVAQNTTGPDGFFQVSAPEPGTYLLRVEMLGYSSQTRSVVVRETQTSLPAFVLEVSAIAMDTLEVEASRSGIRPPGVVGFSRPSHLISGERMATLEKSGASFLSAARSLGAGLRFRSVKVGERSYTCIESSRRASGRGCNMVAIIVDGVDTGLSGDAALRYVHYLNVYDLESMEYYTPVDAGFRYGMRASARGALVLWTRGRGPHQSKARGGGDR
jgi:hypothetical protein